MIAPSRSLHEVSRHHALGRRHGSGGRAHQYGEREWGSGFIFVVKIASLAESHARRAVGE